MAYSSNFLSNRVRRVSSALSASSPPCLDFDHIARPGGQGQHVEDGLGVRLLPVVDQENFRLEGLRLLGENARRARVQPVVALDHHLKGGELLFQVGRLIVFRHIRPVCINRLSMSDCTENNKLKQISYP